MNSEVPNEEWIKMHNSMTVLCKCSVLDRYPLSIHSVFDFEHFTGYWDGLVIAVDLLGTNIVVLK